MEVNLSKNSWHNKLQTFTFGGSKPDLYSLCPYFWLTIFCIVAIPFTIIIKLIVGIVKYAGKIIEDGTNAFIDTLTPLELGNMYNQERFIRKPFMVKKISPYQMYLRWKKRQQAAGATDEDIRLLTEAATQAWLDEEVRKDEEWKAGQEARDMEDAKMLELDAKKKARSQRVKLMWIPIVLWTKRIFNLALTGFIMIALTWFINLLVMTFNPTVTLDVLIFLGWGILILGALLAIISGIVYYVEYNKSNSRVPLFLRPFVFAGPYFFSMFKGIGSSFGWVFKGVGKFFGLFWEYFKATKNDYCPAINWENENDNNPFNSEDEHTITLEEKVKWLSNHLGIKVEETDFHSPGQFELEVNQDFDAMCIDKINYKI